MGTLRLRTPISYYGGKQKHWSGSKEKTGAYMKMEGE
ncbi:hypothetical protein SAMN05421813_10339 [Daejeonella rubra]|uniref:Uncharacterized protein n=1 Tax=Daejeonella rubra TaxID=990371 RepID=A0A1G9NIZ2_9SPHI|nr:hypothetical protein SAMN05421813_10339 [Daejeonella rubra]